MTVLRIVANLATRDPAGLAGFYRDLLGLDLLMDLGFITTLGTAAPSPSPAPALTPALAPPRGLAPAPTQAPTPGPTQAPTKAPAQAHPSVQLSLASEGGPGTALPAISVEVDDLDAVLGRARELGAPIAYGPVTEPWGVRRFYLRDPAGTLVNIVCHN